MSKQSDRLREQAFRAERLSNTISDMSASRTLRSLAEQYHAQADELEQAEMSGQAAPQAAPLQITASKGQLGESTS